MFTQVDKAQAVDWFGLIGGRPDAVVEGDDMGSGTQAFVGDRFEQGQTHAFLSGRRSRIDVENDQIRVGLQLLGEIAILGRDQKIMGRQMFEDLFPFEIGLSQQEDSVRRQGLGNVLGRLQECDGLWSQSHKFQTPNDATWLVVSEQQDVC